MRKTSFPLCKAVCWHRPLPGFVLRQPPVWGLFSMPRAVHAARCALCRVAMGVNFRGGLAIRQCGRMVRMGTLPSHAIYRYDNQMNNDGGYQASRTSPAKGWALVRVWPVWRGDAHYAPTRIGHFEGYFRLFWTNYRWREHRKRMIYKASRITPILRTPDPLVRRQYFCRNILINMSAYGADHCVHALQCTTDHYRVPQNSRKDSGFK